MMMKSVETVFYFVVYFVMAKLVEPAKVSDIVAESVPVVIFVVATCKRVYFV